MDLDGKLANQKRDTRLNLPIRNEIKIESDQSGTKYYHDSTNGSKVNKYKLRQISCRQEASSHLATFSSFTMNLFNVAIILASSSVTVISGASTNVQDPRIEYKIENGVFKKRKVRMCARGDQQQPYEHYNPDDLYAATLKPTEVRLLTAMAAEKGYTIYKTDTKQALAFLYGIGVGEHDCQIGGMRSWNQVRH